MMKKISVVIVEDIREIREGFKSVLNETPDFECLTTYSNAEDAFENIPDTPVDVIVMDINLPGMSGIECVKRLRGKIAHSQIIMFTVYDDDEHIFEALEAGASGYILKKTTPAKFKEAIREIHEGGSPMSSPIARRMVEVFQSKKQSSKEAEILTRREREILELLSDGFLYKEISDQLGIAIGTVKQHIHKIYEKLHVQNKTEAINKIFPSGRTPRS